MNRDELLRRLTELDFFALDLALYLDTHPQCEEALAKYNHTITEADRHRQMYETSYGPLCSFRSAGRRSWPWINNPWPWQEAFNFELS